MHSHQLIDVNINLGHSPLRRVPLDDPQRLVARLREQNVIEAWAGNYDGLFHRDIAAVNDRLASECREQTSIRLIPFGEINPLLPKWQDELERCAKHHRMPGIRVHPNYHGYALDHPEFARLLNLAAEHTLVVALVVQMEDERMMHPLMRVPPVDLTPLADLLVRTPTLRLILLNAVKTPRPDELLQRILAAGDVYIDIAMLETAAAIAELIGDVSPERILFGTHAPMFYVESAVLKLQESALPVPHLRAISSENARRLVESGR